MTPALELSGLSFRVGRRDIVSQVDLQVAPGETIALLGPSGSGKTTLLRLVAGLDRLTAGAISLEGRDITDIPAHRRGFGMMFQDHALFPHLNVAGNVGFGLRGSGWDGRTRDARVAELLGLVGLAGFETRRIDKLSGGERQRVALARALAPRPRLLMLDEPLASLDRALRERLVGELRDILARLDIPAIYVTHDQFEAFAVADRVAIMNEGKLVRVDTPRALWEEPATEFVARFLGMSNIVVGMRDEEGMVATSMSTFGPLPGPPGRVTLLLRDEGVAVAPSGGANIASGTVESVTFKGAATAVRLAGGADALQFEIPSSDSIPSPGQQFHIAVPAVQALV